MGDNNNNNNKINREKWVWTPKQVIILTLSHNTAQATTIASTSQEAAQDDFMVSIFKDV
jgi:hypothetical protein